MPGTTNSGTSFRGNFHSAGIWHAEPHSRVNHTLSCAQGSSQCTARHLAFSVVLYYVLQSPDQKKRQLPTLCYLLFPTLKTQGILCQAFCWVQYFLCVFLFIIRSTAVRLGPLCCLLLIYWHSDRGLTCVSCQSKRVKMAIITWLHKPAPDLGETAGLTLLRFVING